MQHYIGLDVSVKETSVCIVDKAGKVIREVKVATKPVICWLVPPCTLLLRCRAGSRRYRETGPSRLAAASRADNRKGARGQLLRADVGAAPVAGLQASVLPTTRVDFRYPEPMKLGRRITMVTKT